MSDQDISFELQTIKFQLESVEKYVAKGKLKTASMIASSAATALANAQKNIAKKMDEDEDVECSCDDCCNHTVSTFGPLGGCRKVGERD